MTAELRIGYRVTLRHNIDGSVCPFVTVIDAWPRHWVRRSDRPKGWGPHSVYTSPDAARKCANNPWWGIRPGKYYEIWECEYVPSDDTQLRLKGPDGWAEDFGVRAEEATGIAASDIAYAEEFRNIKFICRVENTRRI